MRLICADGRREARPEMCASKLNCMGGSRKAGWEAEAGRPATSTTFFRNARPIAEYNRLVRSRAQRGATKAAVCFRFARPFPVWNRVVLSGWDSPPTRASAVKGSEPFYTDIVGDYQQIFIGKGSDPFSIGNKKGAPRCSF